MRQDWQHSVGQVITSGIATCPRSEVVSEAKLAAQRMAFAASIRKSSSCRRGAAGQDASEQKGHEKMQARS